MYELTREKGLVGYTVECDTLEEARIYFEKQKDYLLKGWRFTITYVKDGEKPNV